MIATVDVCHVDWTLWSWPMLCNTGKRNILFLSWLLRLMFIWSLLRQLFNFKLLCLERYNKCEQQSSAPSSSEPHLQRNWLQLLSVEVSISRINLPSMIADQPWYVLVSIAELLCAVKGLDAAARARPLLICTPCARWSMLEDDSCVGEDAAAADQNDYCQNSTIVCVSSLWNVVKIVSFSSGWADCKKTSEED